MGTRCFTRLLLSVWPSWERRGWGWAHVLRKAVQCIRVRHDIASLPSCCLGMKS